jgi:hypothetical protein
MEQAVAVATVIPTPTVTKNQDIIYLTGTSKLAINGTNFRDKVHGYFDDEPMHSPPCAAPFVSRRAQRAHVRPLPHPGRS